jgi:hypothetical protein
MNSKIEHRGHCGAPALNTMSSDNGHLDIKRSPRRQAQSHHLHKCGPRCILEALIAVERVEEIDAVLANFERLAPETYHATLYYYGALADEVSA